MSDPQVINTLRNKAENLSGYIAKLEADVVQARVDLSHVLAALALFEAPDADTPYPMHHNLERLFKRREIVQLCTKALETGPKNTRELALSIIDYKGFNRDDRHLRKAIAYRIVQALRLQEKRRGPIRRVEKVANIITWILVLRNDPS